MLLGRRFTGHVRFPLLAMTFACVAVGFVAQDFKLWADPAIHKLISNGAFFTAVAIASVAALTRVHVPVPKVLFGLVAALSVSAFCWYLYMSPSVLARAIVLGAAMGGTSLITSLLLLRARPLSIADRLIVLAALLATFLAFLRPALAVTGLLHVDDAVTFQQSDYWLSIQAFTPLISGSVALLFLGAMSIDTFEQLRDEANHDYLTGLLNRRGFETSVVAALSSSGDKPQALLVADIDDFKKINDSFGHKTGDQVIKMVATILAAQGKARFAGRIGGEEFALYYEGDDRYALERNAETIRAALANILIPGLPIEHRLTISIGLHCRISDQDLPDMLLEADRALYRAKEAGKDRAVVTNTPLRSVTGAA